MSANRLISLIRGAARRIWLASLITALVASMPAAIAQDDQRIAGEMRYLYKSLRNAEGNLKTAILRKDTAQIAIVNDLLFTYQRFMGENKHSCAVALESLGGVTVAAMFAIHPVVENDFANRFSKNMRPTGETVKKWYREGNAQFSGAMVECETALGVVVSKRLLPSEIKAISR